jgi:hypothetical protein
MTHGPARQGAAGIPIPLHRNVFKVRHRHQHFYLDLAAESM